MAEIRKAVFPVAGFGTRFLPATKASPKEMLAIVDKPLIQFAVEEAAAAGISQMIFVTGRNKRAIEDHFDKAYELEADLAARGKFELLRQLEGLLPAGVNYAHVRQPEMLGLGHAILCTRHLIGKEPFAVILADDLIDATIPVIKQMVDLYARTESSMVGVEEVPLEQTGSYGMVRVDPGSRLHRVTHIVEKPRPEAAPSRLGVVGRYLLTPAIFDCLDSLPPSFGGEVQLTDALQLLLARESLLAYEFRGTRYDCGSKLGYLKATVEFALKHSEVATQFGDYLSTYAAALGRKPAR
ncbi:MAG: UTP--glucose-1-phosphate uridylyltransferase GalU [Candidatus Accumulibacter sp. UW20]